MGSSQLPAIGPGAVSKPILVVEFRPHSNSGDPREISALVCFLHTAFHVRSVG